MKLRILASIAVGVLLLASPTLARQGEKKAVPTKPAAPPAYDFRGLLQRLYDAWSDLDPAKAAPFYAKEADHVFFDIAPLKYAGIQLTGPCHNSSCRLANLLSAQR